MLAAAGSASTLRTCSERRAETGWECEAYEFLGVMLISFSSSTFENRKCEQLECQSAEVRAYCLPLKTHKAQEPSGKWLFSPVFVKSHMQSQWESAQLGI